MKATGAEIKEFLDTGWNEVGLRDDWCHEEDEVEYDQIQPDEVYQLSKMGMVVWQGEGEIPPGMADYRPLSYYFRKWRDKQANARFVVSVPKEEAEHFRSLMKDLKWKVEG